MPDTKYCYPNSDVLKNKLGVTEKDKLFEVELQLTYIRLEELQRAPVEGKFDYDHLKAIHEYIFQDVYAWAGKERTIEIGKGNIFCLVQYIQNYAKSVFDKYYPQCYAARDDIDTFIRVFADNYSDLNALHPFREGNGRAQREFARLVCMECGYDFDLSCTTHKEMLEASIYSFTNDSSKLAEIFKKAITVSKHEKRNDDYLKILSSDDLEIELSEGYDYYSYDEGRDTESYREYFQAKIDQMNANAKISEIKDNLFRNNSNAS